MSNADVFERVCRFLEQNKLASTLQTFKKEYERDVTRRSERFKKPLPVQISKIKFDKTNPNDVSQVREALQKVDERVLNRLVTKMCRACNSEQLKAKDANCRLQKLKFYRKLIAKQVQAQVLRRERREDKDISAIKIESSNDVSIISKPQEVIGILQEEVDEYENDRDLGYEIYEFPESELKGACKEIAIKKNFPTKALASNSSHYPEQYYNAKTYMSDHRPTNKDVSHHILLPTTLKFPPSSDEFYPIEFCGIIYDAFDLKIVFDQDKTGFEDHKDFQIVINEVIAGRYQIVSVLGQAQFSKAIQVLNLDDGQYYCMKIISNNKDYIDQSIDEIKLLTYINYNSNVDEKHVLKYYDYFYHKQHLIIVTELLKDNLYEAYRLNMKSQDPKYFNLRRVQKVAQQIMTALEYIHSLHIIHSDLKPQNILMKSYSNTLIKVIDFGSSIFFHDNLSFYLQTRSYRAPEVIIGVKYDEKIDIWSAGCIIAQIYSGRVLFENDTVAGLLARIQSIIGGWPEWMVNQGQLSQKFFSKNMVIFQELVEQADPYASQEVSEQQKGTGFYRAVVPKRSNLKARLKTTDQYFIDFVKGCLKIDPSQRLSAIQALQHPFLTEAIYTDEDQ